MTEQILTLHGVSKRFGEVVVAGDLDLIVHAGEAVGIVGPNGAGKSTLFAMIAGELRPDAGTISLAGQEITSLPAQERTRLGIGRTFQIPRPFEHMTVFENLLVFATSGAGLHGSAASTRAIETAERAGLGDLLNTRAGALGLLARKRLELARGLASDPSVLLRSRRHSPGRSTTHRCRSRWRWFPEIGAAAIVWIAAAPYPRTGMVTPVG